LVGKYRPDNRRSGIRALNPLFGTENLRRVEPLLQTLRDVATEVDAKLAQLASPGDPAASAARGFSCSALRAFGLLAY
jgi:hypothetical protein